MSDINLDGWPDIYAGNDFHENDYLYINQKNGSFKDERHDWMTHTSQYSMGVDAADANNDGFVEFDQYLTEFWGEVKQEIEKL